MAHANPEFALGLMRDTPGPVSAQARDLPTARDLMRRMDRILSQMPAARSPENRALADAFIAAAHRCQPGIRRHVSFEQLAVAGAEDERPKRGERFVEPKRRWPQDVQKHGV